jgi:two-component system response regulator PilR (NtrC family)
VDVPPLRERREDLSALAQHFLEKFAKEMGKSIHKLSSYALDMLGRYDFPGNVRELENMIERSVATATTNIILPESLALATFKRREKKGTTDDIFGLDIPPSGVNIDAVLAEIERGYLVKALEMSGGVKQKAAELLGIKAESFRYRFDKHSLGPPNEEKS